MRDTFFSFLQPWTIFQGRKAHVVGPFGRVLPALAHGRAGAGSVRTARPGAGPSDNVVPALLLKREP